MSYDGDILLVKHIWDNLWLDLFFALILSYIIIVPFVTIPFMGIIAGIVVPIVILIIVGILAIKIERK